jgi:uncharacterized protein (DUF58 family)
MIGPLWWLIVASLLVAAVWLRQGPLFFFSLLLLFGSAASALWARYCLAGLQYRRVLGASRLNFGEETELTVEIVNAKPLPLAWLRIHDEWPAEITLLTGQLGDSHRPERRMLENWLAMRWYERVRRVYRLRGAHRGEYVFGPAELTSGDLFGFRWRTSHQETIENLLVYPKLVPLDHWRLPAGRPLGEALAPRRLIPDPLRFAGVRDYVPGDNPRHIHWKNSARWRRLQTRVFDPEATQALVLVADVQTSTFGTYWVVPAYLELIISASASIADQALDQRRAVGLYTNASAARQAGTIEVPISRAPGQRAVLMEAFARMRSFALLTGEDLLQRLTRSLPWGATVVVLSARPSAGLQAALLTVQDAGHATTLLTVGEEPIETPASLDVHYLGGIDAWENLAALELG